MRILPFLISLFVLGCATDRPPQKPFSETTPDWEKLWIQNGCSLQSFAGELRTFPGNHCIFLPDGSFVSGTSTTLRKFSSGGSILWERKGHYHHQVNLSVDGKRIIALSSELASRRGKKIRDDLLLILDLEGKEVSRKTSPEILKESGVSPLKDWRLTPGLRELGADEESTHFNSLYEIPENVSTSRYLKAGNIIANSSILGIFIFSPDLKKTLFHRSLDDLSTKHALHDVQVTPKGEFLIFNNFVRDDSGRVYSAIQKYDPETKSLTFNYTAEPREMFFSPACGGVQEIGELIFFSHIVGGGFLISGKTRELIRAVPGSKGDPKAIEPTQQLKLVDMNDFFRNQSSAGNPSD